MEVENYLFAKRVKELLDQIKLEVDESYYSKLVKWIGLERKRHNENDLSGLIGVLNTVLSKAKSEMPLIEIDVPEEGECELAYELRQLAKKIVDSEKGCHACHELGTIRNTIFLNFVEKSNLGVKLNKGDEKEISTIQLLMRLFDEFKVVYDTHVKYAREDF